MHRRFITGLVFATSLMLASLASADQHSGVVAGAWDMVLDVQGQVFNLDLTIAEGSDGLTGTMGSPQGETTLSQVQFDGETLSFNSDDGFGGTMSIALKYADGGLSGNLDTPMGALPITATKK